MTDIGDLITQEAERLDEDLPAAVPAEGEPIFVALKSSTKDGGGNIVNLVAVTWLKERAKVLCQRKSKNAILTWEEIDDYRTASQELPGLVRYTILKTRLR